MDLLADAFWGRVLAGLVVLGAVCVLSWVIEWLTGL